MAGGLMLDRFALLGAVLFLFLVWELFDKGLI